MRELIQSFWRDVVNQDATKLEIYFVPNATINWHNTNESFTVSEYIIANCEYPGDWCSEVCRLHLR